MHSTSSMKSARMPANGWLPAVFALLAGVAGCDPIQPKPQCKVNRQDYAAALFVEGTTPPACAMKVLTGETLHLQSYSPDPGKSGDNPGIGIEPALVAEALENAEHAMVASMVTAEFSFAKFTSLTPPADNDFCRTETLPPTKIAVPMIPADPAMMREAHDPVNLTYEWSDLVSLVKATSNGVHFGATLRRTDGDCVMTYKVSAVTPVVACGNGRKDTEEIDPATMKPVVDPATGKPVQVDDPHSGQPVDAKCCPGRDNGLPIDITYKCDAATLLCLPSKQFPSLDTTGVNLKCM